MFRGGSLALWNGYFAPGSTLIGTTAKRLVIDASTGTSLRDVIRSGGDLGAVLDEVWAKRDDRYSEVRSSNTARLAVPVEMSYIGG